MPLTDQQLETVRALDWLFSPEHRRTGRSFAIAVALVRRAALHPRTDVRYGDLPFEVTRANWEHTVIGMTQALIAGDPMLSPHVTYHPEYFRLDLSVAVQDWWPPESFLANVEPPAQAFEEITQPIGRPPGEPNANGDIFDLSQDADLRERMLQRLTTAPGASFGSMTHSVDELVAHAQNMGLALTSEEAESLIRGPGGAERADQIRATAQALAARLATQEGQAAMQAAEDATRVRIEEERQRGRRTMRDLAASGGSYRQGRGRPRPMVMLPPEPPAHAENRAELSRQVQALRVRPTAPQPTRPNRYDLLVGDEAVE